MHSVLARLPRELCYRLAQGDLAVCAVFMHAVVTELPSQAIVD